MKFLIFTITQLSIFVLGSLLLWTLSSDRFRIWPPPDKKSWQYHSTLTLIRIIYTGTIGVAILDWNTFVFSHYSRYLLGIPLAIIGFGIAFYGLFYLGLTNSYGLKGGLITTGIYQYSRNPQYTGLMIGIVGFALICNSSLIKGSSLDFIHLIQQGRAGELKNPQAI